jgi:hypothetical protein
MVIIFALSTDEFWKWEYKHYFPAIFKTINGNYLPYQLMSFENGNISIISRPYSKPLMFLHKKI